MSVDVFVMFMLYSDNTYVFVFDRYCMVTSEILLPQ